MQYYLKLVGLSTDPLPVEWWAERPELVERIYFSRRPSIEPGDVMVYYAVGGDGRLCGVVRAVGTAGGDFERPAAWGEALRAKLRFAMPVRVLHKCPADDRAPRWADFSDRRIGQGSYQQLDAEAAGAMIAAIERCAVRGVARATTP